MENLVINQNGQLVTNSLLVAEKFGKPHKNVLASIRELLTSAEKLADVFQEVSYLDNYNREQPMFAMNRDGFSLLVMGFTGESALEFKLDFIDAFNKMEAELKAQQIQPLSFEEMVKQTLLLADARIKELECKIKEDAPRVGFAETIEKSSDSILVRQMSKILGNERIVMGEKKLYAWLRQKGLILKTKNEPSHTAIEKGYFTVDHGIIKTIRGDIQTKTSKVTGKGQIYILQTLKEELYGKENSSS